MIYGRFSRDHARTVQLAGNGDPRYEAVVEVGHRIQLTKWAFVQPDVQYVIKPYCTGRLDDALVVGAEMGITF